VNDTADLFRDWDAAYVLGALSSDDRRAYERHLATCPECTAAVADLAGLPGILGKLPAADAVGLLSSPEEPQADAHLVGRAHVPGLVQRLAGAAKRRRRRARIGLIGSGVIVVALLVIAGIAISVAPPSNATAVAMTPLDQNVITASLQVEKKGWGTRFDWSCSYPGDGWKSVTGASYDLVVTDKSGGSTTVATWSTSGPHASGLSASTSIPTDNIKNVEIRLSGTTAPLLRENL
jgi:hypothetical protein